MSTGKKQRYFGYNYNDSEIIIGLVSPVGTRTKHVVDHLRDQLRKFRYTTDVVSVSDQVISSLVDSKVKHKTEYDRINAYMDYGNKIRAESKDSSILALGVSAMISDKREKDDKGETKPFERKATIVKSLKHPAEVQRLREIYNNGFFLISIYEKEIKRKENLVKSRNMSEIQAECIINRDKDENEGHGQHTRDTFQMADIFISIDDDDSKLLNDIIRVVELMFGNPFITPTFEEYAMYMAFASSLRSADLSRQVGAVISKNEELISYGANDCPKYGGGLYWPYYDKDDKMIKDFKYGRDYTIGYDSNANEKKKILESILNRFDGRLSKKKLREAIESSDFNKISEYGRSVHAEMEAILFCARNNISTKSSKLYCTTFPCHNCAKHIIAAGIEEVVYIEPYPKSKAFDFHGDAICSETNKENRVVFKPFVGVGPRRFIDLFSMTMSSGKKIYRKEKDGNKIEWNCKIGNLRIQMQPNSYLENEIVAMKIFAEYGEKNERANKKTEREHSAKISKKSR